jgi:hypothetical protein
MNIGNEVKIELKSNFVNSVSNQIYDSIFDYVTYDIWYNISRKIWNPVSIANNSSNELI